MKIQQIEFGLLRPYWRNPRFNEGAVEAVKQSITEYGFINPIIVDPEMVIIAGHTRYKAASQLGLKKVPCIVVDLPQEKAREYRIADNKTSELAVWNMDMLMQELREFTDAPNMQIYFKDMDLASVLKEHVGGSMEPPTQEAINAKQEVVDGQFSNAVSNVTGNYVELMCPHCAESFYVDKTEVNNQPSVAEPD